MFGQGIAWCIAGTDALAVWSGREVARPEDLATSLVPYSFQTVANRWWWYRS